MYFFFVLVSLMYIFVFYPNFLRGIGKYQVKVKESDLIDLLSGMEKKSEFVIQITTKGGETKVIKNGLKILNSFFGELASEIQDLIRVEILTEIDADKREFVEESFLFDLKFFVVPKNYNTKNRTKLKARALQYMIEKRMETGQQMDRLYIIHFDAESIISKNSLITMIYRVLSQRDHTIFQGPISYPMHWKRANIFSRQMESLRPWNCYECYIKTEKSIPYHLHGSNIVIRADAEYKVGWDYQEIDGYPPVAEDLFFGIRAALLYGKSAFGWHGAMLYEQPAFTIRDSVKQRVRWIRGSLQALRDVPSWDEFQSLEKINKKSFMWRIRTKLYIYGLGFIPAIFSLTLLLYAGVYYISNLLQHGEVTLLDVFMGNEGQNPILIQIVVAIPLLGAVLWLLSIQIGLYYNLRTQETSIIGKVIEHLKILLVTPFASVIDTGTVFFTILFWLFGNHKAVWEVTPKIPSSEA